MPTIITPESHPALAAAFRAIEEDNGGHLIGTVYPNGEDEDGKPTFTPMDLDRFEVPDDFAHLVPKSEIGLARLKAESEEDFDTLMTGNEEEVDSISARQGDLAEAMRLTCIFFNGWTE